MLQQIRTKAAGAVAKFLFVLLVASFAIWGIGDPRWLARSEPPAVTVDGEAISVEQLRQDHQRDLERLRRAFGGELDRDLVRQLGLVNQTIERTVSRAVVDRAAQDLGFLVDDNAVRDRIVREPSFQVGGQFDRAAFQRALFEQQMNEPRFIQLMRGELARGALVDAVTLGAGAPPILIDALYRHREERRRGAYLNVAAAGMPDPGTPADADLKALYERDLARFTDPEFRAGTIVRIGPAEILSSIIPDEEQLKREYEQRAADFAVPERRAIQLIRFDDEPAAAAARAKIAAGADFVAVAEEAGQKATEIDFGIVRRDELTPDLAAPLFALPVGEVSAPIRTALGTFVGRVTAVELGRQPDFAELRDRLAKEVAERLAGEVADRAVKRLEELINGGTPLAAAAQQVGVPAMAVAAVDARGLDRAGQPVAELLGAPEALRALFDTLPGRDSGLVESRGGAWTVVHVDSATPSQPRPFEQVRAQVVEAWKQERRDEAARLRAEELEKKVAGGASLVDAGAPFGLVPEAIPATRRDGRREENEARVPAAIAGKLFELPKDGVGIAPSSDGYAVVKLEEIVPADPAADAAGIKRLTEQLAGQIAGEVANEYTQALRQRYRVVIDPTAAGRIEQSQN